MERELKVLQARSAIEGIVFGYAEAIDMGDIERVGELLPDCRLVMPDGSRLEGGAAIAEHYRSIILFYDERGVAADYCRHQTTPRTRHVTTNLQFEFSEDAASADVRSYFSVYQALDGAMPLIAGGRYLDHFESADDRWRLTRRAIAVDHSADMSRHERQALR